jgi:hypothetical protein
MFRHLSLVAVLLLLTSATARAADEPIWAMPRTEKRPAALTALYGSYAALQVADVVTTRRAIAAGAREQNPLMGSGGTGQMIAIKAAAGASTIFFVERLWKKNKVGAVVVMAALNGATAAIAMRNARNASGRNRR